MNAEISRPEHGTGSQRFSVAVIGCGAIAQSHLAFLHRNPLVDLVAIVDVSPTVTEHLAAMLGPGVRWYSDHGRMLAEVTPDVVHVLTPPASHVAISADALRGGAHVLCEKPIAANAADVADLLVIAAASDRRIMECQNYRYLSEMYWLREVCADPRFGKIRSVDIDVRVPIAAGGRFADDETPHYVSHLPGGAVRDFLPHMVYLAEDLMPYLRVEVRSADWRLLSGRRALGSDTLTALLAGEHETVGLRFSAIGNPPGFRVAVVGDDGSASVDLYHRRRTLELRSFGGPLAAVFDRLGDARLALTDALGEVRNKVLHSGENGIATMLEDVYEHLAASESFPVAPERLHRTAAVIDDLVNVGGLG